MPTLLHISSSPRGEKSESLALATTLLDTVRATSPDVAIDTWDLWDGTLPAFGPPAAAAKMAVFAGADPQGEQAAAWREAITAFERFDAADQYLFSIPMWNAGVPYILKQFIDVVSQPGHVFGFDAELGYTGLLTGKRAVVITTGAVWGPDRGTAFGSNFLNSYFTDWLRWAGVEDITEIGFHPNLATSDPEPGRRAAEAAARRIGRDFARPRAGRAA